MNKAYYATLAVLVLFGACSNPNTNQPTATQTPGGGSSAPSAQQASIQKNALVRFVQAVPGNQKMDLWFGDMKVFSNVNYKDVTPYVEVPAERHEFKLQTAGDTQPSPMASNSEGLSAGEHYTIVAEGKEKGGVTLDPIKDTLTPAANGKAKVRVINAALGMGKLDVYYPNGKIATGVGVDSYTSYNEVAPGQGTVEIRRADKKVDVARIPNMSLEADKLYTLLVMGGAGHALTVIPVVDQLASPVPPSGQ